jgi:NAD(P)-dependent dehydrogenase (short-subunit alcohol dehydrogenase family)
MPGRLHGKVVLVTGIGSGMGRETALLFAREGATVVGCDINEASMSQTLTLAQEEGLDIAATTALDLTRADDVAQWIHSAAEEHGRIDVLYNNASLPRFAPFAVMSGVDYEFTIRNELDLVWHASQIAWPYLIKSRGNIINIGSGAGLLGARTLPQAAHAAAKGAVLALTRQLAAEGVAVGVRVNSVSPGVMATPPVQAMYEEFGENSPVASIVGRTLSGAPGDPRAVAYAGLYLASDEASWVTGINIVVDGGASAFM